ncbi:TonB-dependent receptor [Pedobacter polaris]|uniref:TonB-dependent receptor n=1 Tax=Pedobacter polaris TaxID=2571273 RepID=A0A4V5P2E8_9SPHI|nr:TonB-dependent receptor [Pedobacter polaris]TKC08085.1 TonB-dependent receptor [Pedobacter polaris]
MHNSTKINVIKLLLAMTRFAFLVTIVSITLTGVLMAAEVKSQDINKVKVTLALKNNTLAELLKNIEHQTSFTFTFAKQIGDKKLDAFLIKERSLADVLKELSSIKRLKFTQLGSLIAISELPVPPKPGRISGKITDEMGGALPGASIKIIETGAVVQSDPDGSYSIKLQPGTYTLEFSYISFQTQRVTAVVVTENQNTSLNIALKIASSGLKEVVVTSSYKKASIASLYKLQQNTSNLSDGISAEQISATPDKHVGETLKRITGVSTTDNRRVVVRGIAERYNVSLLNGSTLPSTSVQQRDFEFNLIPTNLVENIVVAKSMTADMPYGFAGGLIQITTKSVPNENFLSFSAGTSFNSITTGKDFMGYGRGKYDYFGFDDGERNHFPEGIFNLGGFDPRLPDAQNKIKAAQVGEQNKRIGGTERLGTRIFKAMPSQNYQVSIGRSYALDSTSRKRIGFVASASYRNTQSNDEIASMRRGDWSQQPARGDDPTDVNTGNIYGFNTTMALLVNGGFKTPSHQINTYNLYTRIFDNRFSRITGWSHESPKNDSDMKFAGTAEDDRPKFTDLLQNKLSSTHKIGKVKIEWSAARTVLKSIEKDAVSASINTREIGNMAPFSFYVPNSYSDPGFGAVHRDQYTFREQNFDAILNVSYDFKIGSTSHTFKTGVNYLKKHAEYNWGILPISIGSKSTIPIAQIPIQQWGNYMDMSGPGSNLFYFPANYSLNKFEAESANKGGFVMMDHKLFSNLRIVYGLRSDYYKLDTVVNAASILGDKNSRLIFAEEKDWRVMPSANITYSPVKELNIRASYAKSAVRPGMMENSRFSRFDPDYGSQVKSSGVSSTIIDNYDAKIELFPGAGELLSVGYFYKYLDKPAEFYRLDRENNGVGYINITNSDWAKVKGWEFELRKSLGFIADKVPFLANVYLSGNLTLQKSTVRARELQVKVLADNTDSLYYTYIKHPRALYGQVPLLYNAGLQYVGKKLGLNLTYNHAGYKTFITASQPNLVEYERPRSQFDAQISYKFLKGKMESKLNMSNLLNAPFRHFINDGSTFDIIPDGVGEEWQDRFKYKFGFTEKFEEGYVDPATNRQVGDRQSSTRYLGTTFSLSLTYNL